MFKMSQEHCRLCGKDAGLTNVFDESGLCLKISTCFGIKINQEDVISKNICKSCYFSINYFYEFRLSAIAHDTKLQKEYAESHPEVTNVPISYPSKISQNAFLNTLNLTNKNDTLVSKPVFHQSVLNLKRKYPNINLPKECYALDIDPTVVLDTPAKIVKVNDLGIWSVKNKQLRSKQPDIILTRIRSNNLNKNSSNDKVNYSVKVNVDNVPLESPSKKKKKRSSQWIRKKRQIKRSPTKTSETISTKETEKESSKTVTPFKLSPSVNIQTLSFKKKSSPKEENSVETLNNTATSTKNSTENNQLLKRLLRNDRSVLSLSETSKIENQVVKSEEYGNLLVSVGEEVQTFICQTCNQIFDTLAELNNHKKYNHKSSLRCTKCSKRFSIVESLVQHNLAHHPEINEPLPSTSSTKLMESNETIPLCNTTARKRTNGGFVPMIHTNTETDINTISLDSDDDSVQDILSISSNDNMPKELTVSTTEIGKSGMKSKKPDLFCDDVLCIDFSDDDCLENKNIKNKKQNSGSSNNDSDNSNGNKSKSNTSKESQECFLIIDDSNSSSSKSIDTEMIPLNNTNSTESNPISSTEMESNNIETSVCQKIVVVPSGEDKEHMEAASSIKAKITNELSYINYIFNKCSFSERPKNEKKWYLRDIHKFTEKTYLPIEVIKSNTKELSVEYTPAVPETPRQRLAFWDTANAIDIPINRIGLDKPIIFNRARDGAKKYFAENVQKEIQCPPETHSAVSKETEITATSTVTPPASNAAVVPVQENINPNIASTSGTIQTIDKTKTDEVQKNLQVVSKSKNSNPAYNILTIPTAAITKQSINSLSSKTRHSPIVLNPTVNVFQTKNPNKSSLVSIGSNDVSSINYKSKKESNQNEPPVQLHNGFILMGLKTDANGILKPTGDSAYLISEVDKTNSMSLPKQPIIINGLSYPTVAKMKNSIQQTLVLQQIGQQPNAIAQNCIIAPQEITSEQNQPTAQQQNDACAGQATVPKITSDTTSDSTVTSTKPMIRIKNLSELQDGTIVAHQRQELHTNYTTTLSNYVQNHSTTLISEPTSDEYLQIS